jgi:KaiC/GvpD/RAD55 family RecA-like ATPase
VTQHKATPPEGGATNDPTAEQDHRQDTGSDDAREAIGPIQVLDTATGNGTADETPWWYPTYDLFYRYMFVAPVYDLVSKIMGGDTSYAAWATLDRTDDGKARLRGLELSMAAIAGVDPLYRPGIDTITAETSRYLSWDRVLKGDDGDEDQWLLEPVLARGRGHAIYASHKQGKSLFALWAAAEIAHTGIDVIYLDYEMSQADVRDRVLDMGYDVADDDLFHLHYALLPDLRPLDTDKGAADLAAYIRDLRPAIPGGLDHSDNEIAVVIDTMSRAAKGKENDSDTYRDFYRHTGTMLKRAGVTYLRLDHAGKDTTRGQRGSSAKGDDVDVVWRLQRGDKGVTLHNEASRMSWVPAKVAYRMVDNPLGYEQAPVTQPAGTFEMAATLERIGVPLNLGRRKAKALLDEHGITATNEVLGAAIKWRRHVAEQADTERLIRRDIDQ